MFAGRYLWWTLIAIATFLFFAVYFDYVGWAIVQSSGCAKSAGSCGPLSTYLSDVVKPTGFWVAGGIVFVCTVARIHYLRMNLLWAVAVGIWFLSAEPFPMLFSNIFDGQLRLGAIYDAIPVSLLFLSALVAYLQVPFDENGRDPLGRWRLTRYAACGAAAYGAGLAMALEPRLPVFLGRELGFLQFQALIEHLQPQLASALLLGSANPIAALHIAYWIFLACLAASLLPQERIELLLLRLEEFMQRGSRPRRSGRA